MKINSIHHIAIICSDYQKSKDFYVNKLGFIIKSENFRAERNSFKLDIEINGKYQIELFSFPNSPQRVSYPEAQGLRHLAFSVDDVNETVNELHKKGIATEPIRVDEYTGKHFTFFKDPDDLPIEIYEK
jgi:glyoxylase I family protein